MIKLHALKLLGMCFPQDKPSKLNHCLTEIQTFNMMHAAIAEIPDEEMLNDLLHKRVLQLVQNRKHPREASEWKAAYAANMMSRITGECAYKYCYDCATNSMEAIGYPEWMCTTPSDAVQEEMECWDE